MFKDTYREKFDAIRPDPALRQLIEERMNEMQTGNDRRRARVGMSRRMIAVLAAVLVLMLAATAAAVVRGNLLRSKLEEKGDETIAAQVQDVHIADVADEFGFTIDEVVWEDDKIFLSYQVSVPDDGRSYLYGVYVPELNGQEMQTNQSGYFDKLVFGGDVYAIGGKFSHTANKVLQELIADPALKGRTDNVLHARIVFFETDRPIEKIDYEALEAKLHDAYMNSGMVGWGDRILDNSDVLYYLYEDANPMIALSIYPEVEAVYERNIAELPPMPEDAGFTFEETDFDYDARRDLEATAHSLTADSFASTGIASIAAERELTIALNLVETQDTVYNDLAQNLFEMDGYTIEITDFRLTHFLATIEGYIRKNGELILREDDGSWFDGGEYINPLADEPLARNYALLRPDGSFLTGEYPGAMGCNLYWEDEGTPVIKIGCKIHDIISLDDLSELLLAPVEMKRDENGQITEFECDLENAVTLTPIYNPDKREPAPTYKPIIG